MSNKTTLIKVNMALYIEIDSTYRNRNLWPNPAEFEMALSQSGRNINSAMLDPVCVAIPEQSWTASLFDVAFPAATAIQAQITLGGFGNTNAPTEIVLNAIGLSQFQQQYNYYKHAVVRHTVLNSSARIIESKYLGNNLLLCKLLTPFEYQLLDLVDIQDPTDLTNAVLFIPNGSNNQDKYVNRLCYNESTNDSCSILSYDSKIGTLFLDTVPAAWLPTHSFSIRKASPNYIYIAGALSTNSIILLPPTTENLSNWFIRVPRSIYNNTVVPPEGETRQIISYDTTTFTATVNPPFSASPAGLTIELMQEGYDSVNPFSWRGTLSQEVPVYRVRLLKLILPNLPMVSLTGGNPALANYFYVELSNSGSPTRYSICSNNPAAVKAGFRVTVQDVVRLNELQYVTLTGDVTQDIRIRLDSTLYFKVTASSGELFQPIVSDNFSPLPPEPSVQITALFECTPT